MHRYKEWRYYEEKSQDKFLTILHLIFNQENIGLSSSLLQMGKRKQRTKNQGPHEIILNMLILPENSIALTLGMIF